MTRALVLSGGGARGSFQVGMLEELILKQKLDFQIIRGVSVGALNAAFLAQAAKGANAATSQTNLAKRLKELRKVWDGIQGDHSIYKDRGGFPGLIVGGDSLYSLKPLRTLLEKKLKMSAIKNSGRDFKVGTVSLVSGLYHEWGPRDADFLEKIIASASIPVVFPFVDMKKKKDVLVDGGVRNITPLSSAFKAQPDEIYILLTSRLLDMDAPSGAEEHSYEKWDDNWLGTSVNGLDVLERTLDLLTDEIYLEDIRNAQQWNAIAGAIEKLEGKKAGAANTIKPAIQEVVDALGAVKKRHVKLNVIAPQVWFDENASEGSKNASTNFSPALIKNAIEHGRAIAADPNRWLVRA